MYPAEESVFHFSEESCFLLLLSLPVDDVHFCQSFYLKASSLMSVPSLHPPILQLFHPNPLPSAFHFGQQQSLLLQNRTHRTASPDLSRQQHLSHGHCFRPSLLLQFHQIPILCAGYLSKDVCPH